MTRIRGLYAIVDPAVARRDALPLVTALLEGGARIVQLRWKTANGRQLFEASRDCANACAAAGALFIVNDRPDVAALVGAHLHLGQDDVPVAVARKILPPNALVGVSTHSDAEIDAALAAGVDYIGFGPIFHTATKAAHLPPPHGLDGLRRACARAGPTPVVAIGGFTPELAVQARDAGAQAVAVIGDLCRAPDVAARVRQYGALT